MQHVRVEADFPVCFPGTCAGSESLATIRVTKRDFSCTSRRVQNFAEVSRDQHTDFVCSPQALCSLLCHFVSRSTSANGRTGVRRGCFVGVSAVTKNQNLGWTPGAKIER